MLIDDDETPVWSMRPFSDCSDWWEILRNGVPVPHWSHFLEHEVKTILSALQTGWPGPSQQLIDTNPISWTRNLSWWAVFAAEARQWQRKTNAN